MRCLLRDPGHARQPMATPTRASGGRSDKIAWPVVGESSQAETETIAVMDYSSTEIGHAAASMTPGSDSSPAATQDELADHYVARAMARTFSEVAALHLEIRRWQESIGQNHFADIYDSQRDLRDALGYYVMPGGNFWLATTTTGEVAGFVGLKNTGAGIGSVKRLAVAPRHQGRGVGHRLMAALMDWAQRAGFCELYLATGVHEKAKGIYTRHGFVTINEHRGDYLMGCALQRLASDRRSDETFLRPVAERLGGHDVASVVAGDRHRNETEVRQEVTAP